MRNNLIRENVLMGVIIDCCQNGNLRYGFLQILSFLNKMLISQANENDSKNVKEKRKRLVKFL